MKALIAILLLAVVIGAQADPEIMYHSGKHHGPPLKRFTVYTKKGGFIAAKGGSKEDAWTIGGYQEKLSCGSENGPEIAQLYQTGIYLQAPASGSQMMNNQVAISLTSSCDGSGVGTINSVGLAPGGDWTGLGPFTFNVVGGTGDFSGVIGGLIIFRPSTGLSGSQGSSEIILYY